MEEVNVGDKNIVATVRKQFVEIHLWMVAT